MRVLLAHNGYRQRGGEDAVVEAEANLLRGHGHEVEFYGRHNDELGLVGAPRAALDALWSARTVREVGAVLAANRPDVVHVHNTFPLISPSIYWAASRAGVPVVQTLHNFRLMCPQAVFLRRGAVCEDCLGRVPWRGVVRACYRESRPQSAVLAGTLIAHRVLGTWQRHVARYIALNEFCRAKFIAGGLPAERIVVKPNFVDWDGGRSGIERKAEGGGRFLFVGRLSPEKGLRVLAAAVAGVEGLVVRVAGTGSEEDVARRGRNLVALGQLDEAAVRAEMTDALALVIPSVCYESFPRALVEAFASGLPVIASRLGALAELVRDHETGLLFAPGNAEDLAEKLRWAVARPEEMRRMGRQARREYEARYTPEENVRALVSIYRDAIDQGVPHGT